ncbi:MAG: NADH-quinone oxidoreductase subunit J [Candidatus Omnitrophica bacterium]|nr:NADH-quinone oxidoreductase subunit J [Candidatus Omnitrophota bacterium]MDE2221752.1 NADH-quinone oxidoreductase subunit J [Candidatus Omnitrophota bacterium]
MSFFFFFLFAAILIAASLAVVYARNPLYNVLALVVTIFALSCLFVTLEAFFVGMILLLVYAGAVLVFFLFVVICLNLNTAGRQQASPWLFQGLGTLAGMLFAGSFALALMSFFKAQAIPASNLRGTIEAVGKILFTDYLLPFEMTSLLLLVAVFGIVSLAQGALSTGKDEAL